MNEGRNSLRDLANVITAYSLPFWYDESISYLDTFFFFLNGTGYGGYNFPFPFLLFFLIILISLIMTENACETKICWFQAKPSKVSAWLGYVITSLLKLSLKSYWICWNPRMTSSWIMHYKVFKVLLRLCFILFLFWNDLVPL